MSGGDPSTGDFVRSLQAGKRLMPGAECPDEERLRWFAVGLTNPAESNELLQHTATCDWCGALLREAVQDFATAPTREENKAADTLRRDDGGRRRIPRPGLIWGVPAGVLAAVLAAFSPALIQNYRLASARRSTNEAFAATHLLPMRFSGVKYTAVSTVRGGETSHLSQPAELFDAESDVKRGIDAHPDDPEWLQLQGRIDLLVGKEDAAVAELERAQSLRSKDPEILSDLGAAHYRKAEKTGDDPQEYADAFESFSKGAVLAPKDPVLLFNKALAAEHLYAFHEAQDDWAAYLRTDSRGGWAGEARTHLDAVKKKLERQRAYTAATTPESLMGELRSGKPWDQLFAPDEEYLKIAVTHLLPGYYSTPPDEEAGRILRRMADVFVERHQDTWLRDALRTRHSPPATKAFQALAAAVESEIAGEFSGAVLEAEKAMRLFQAAGSGGGRLRAEYERLYTLEKLGRNTECLRAIVPLSRALAHTHYRWLQTEAQLEGGASQLLAGDLDRAEISFRGALHTAAESSYSAISLQAIAFEAGRHAYIGNNVEAWRENTQGLARYWSAAFPLMRAQHFYSQLSFLAERTNSAYSNIGWARELDKIASALKRDHLRAAALHQMALAEVAAGLETTALQRLRQAVDLAAALRPEERQVFILGTEIEMAALEAERGATKEPLARLLAIETEAGRSDAMTRLRFDTELGKLRLKQGQYEPAVALLESAVKIAERSRASASGVDRLPWTRAMGNSYRGLVECEIKRGADPRRSWRLWSGYRASLLDQRSVFTANEDAIASGEAMLSFAELPSGLAVWLATPRAFLFRWLDPQIELAHDATERFVRGCASELTPREVLRADGRQLSNWLLGPWDHELDGVQTVIIESDRPVASMPWPALVRSNGHYWSDDFAMRIRVGSGGALRDGAPLLRANLLAVGAPALAADEHLPPLPDARAEAERIASLFPHAQPLIGRAATVNEVRSRLSTVELFHFAGHGFGGEGGGLLLASATGGTALLRAADIENLDLRACRLAVLSGCSTGAGELKGPGDPQSLVRAFLHAGTHKVVASLWNLNSAGTALFMQNFYQGILNGTPAAESLRLASQALRSRSTYMHPYYWAGLQLFTSE